MPKSKDISRRVWNGVGPGSFSCEVELREEKLKKVSKAERIAGEKVGAGREGACVAGRSFGCYPRHASEAGTMWVSDGCRGLFFCNKAKAGICGNGMPEAAGFQAGVPLRGLVNCSCSENEKERIAINKAWWRSQKAQPVRLFERTQAKVASFRWLLAASISCGSGHDRLLARSDVSNFGASDFHLWFNVYDGVPASHCLPSAALALPFVHTSHVSGYMTLFWKSILTPAVTAGFDLIALKDGDVLLSPHTFVRAEVEYWLERTNASIVTPAIVPRGRGYRSGRDAIASKPLWADCLAVASPYAEQVKIARVEAFQQSLRAELLLPFSDRVLETDSYLMHLWCILSAISFPSRPGCVHLRHVSAIHFDSRTINKAGMGKLYFRKSVGVANTIELYRRHQWAWDTFDGV